MLKIDNYTYKPTHLLADSASAIENGFKIAFPDQLQKRIVCWAHCHRALTTKYLNRIKDTSLRAKVKEDVKKIQVAHSPEAFEAGVKLLWKKWNEPEVRSSLEAWGKY